MLAAFTVAAYFAISLWMYAANCSGVPPPGSAPSTASRSRTSEPCSNAMTSRLSASITGRGVPAKNLPLGVKLIQQASDAGDTRATDLLGDCYAHATGVPLNFDEAFRLFTQAADHGNPASIGNLGVLYMTGRGVPAPNPKKAAELFEKGARADDPPSMFNFAQCLNEGIGTAKNELESKIWFRRSAEAGDERAAAWCLKNHLPFTIK